MPRVLPVILAIAVIVFALIDCARTPDDRMPARIPKAIWIILILFLPVIAAVAWIVLSRIARGETGRGAAAQGSGGWNPGGAGPRRPARGPVAPDDDPEFLARLEADRRRRERERRQRERDEAKEGWETAAGAAPTSGADAGTDLPVPDIGTTDVLDPPTTDDRSDDDGSDEHGGGVAVDDPRDTPSSPA